MKPIFLLLGGNKLNYGIMRKFQQNGYLVYVIDWNEHPDLLGDKHYRIDVKDPKAIIFALKKSGAWKNIVFAYSSMDPAVVSTAFINRKIGLKTITDEGLLYSSSKSIMTKQWSKLGLLNRISKSYKEFDDKIVILNQDYKIIIKPDDSSSSRGITIIEKGSTYNAIFNAFLKAKKEAGNGIVVIEEFVEGTEFTVEMIGDSFGNVSVYAISRKAHTRNTINNKIAVKLHYNSVDDKLQQKIAMFGIKCYKALYFSASLGHLEIVMKDDGTISPIEIGARSSGFIASDLVDIVSNKNYLGDFIAIQKGAKVVNGLHPQTDRSSIYFFYDFPEGSCVVNDCNLLDFCDKSIKSRYFDRSNIVKGRKFRMIDNDNARLGYEILEGPKNLMTREYILEAEKKMLNYMLGKKNDF